MLQVLHKKHATSFGSFPFSPALFSLRPRFKPGAANLKPNEFGCFQLPKPVSTGLQLTAWGFNHRRMQFVCAFRLSSPGAMHRLEI